MRDLVRFLLEKRLSRGNVDKTLFTKSFNNEILIMQFYFDDIIFCASNQVLCEDFANLVPGEFEMSMMGELSFFLGL